MPSRLPPGASFVGVVSALALLVGGSLFLPASAPCPPVATAPAGGTGNLLTGEQADFAHSSGAWAGEGAELSWVAGVGGRPGALEMSPSGSPPSGPGQWVSAWSSWPEGGGSSGMVLTAAVAGQVYEGSAQVMAGDGATDGVDAALGFWDSQGRGLAWAPATIDHAGPGSWTTTSTAVALAPPGAAYVALGVMEWSSTGSWSLYVSDPVLSASTVDPAAVVGPLRTSGTQIIEGNGTPVILRGISYLGLATSSHPSDFTEATFEHLHAWGFSLVRFFLNEDLWDTQSCAYDPDYRAAVGQAVSWTTSLGMVALLTLQAGTPQDIGASGSCLRPAYGAAGMADAPASDIFWSTVASSFGANPLVAFDLFNEPNGISAQQWLDGGAQDGFQAEGMQQLYDDVRGAGATNLVFVEGDNWANTPPSSGDLVQGYNVVYDAHYYTCPHAGPPECTASDPYDPGPGLAPWARFQQANAVPVFVGEFGWPSPADGTYNANVIAYAESQGWGWAAYTFDSYTGDEFDLVASAPSSGPFEPSPAGMPVLAAVASPAPGTPAPGGSGGPAPTVPGPAPTGTAPPAGAGQGPGGTGTTGSPDAGGHRRFAPAPAPAPSRTAPACQAAS
jgi:endoglucanase